MTMTVARALALAGATLLAGPGCSYDVALIYGRYKDAAITVVTLDCQDAYEVLDNTGHQFMMVRTYPLSEAGRGFCRGVGFRDIPPFEVQARRAAERQLANTGRDTCHVESGRPLSPTQYEFTYRCA